MKKTKYTYLFLSLVFALSFFLFSPSIHGDFLNWDDTIYITSNELVYNEISLSSFKDLYAFEQYISLVLFSFLIQINLLGSDPFYFHLINILLHLVNVALVFKLSQRLLKNDFMALSIALLFSIHPLKAESVCWIIQRKDLLFSMFF